MNQNIRRLQGFFLAAFLSLLLALIYWQVIRADNLLSRGENPRPIIAEQRIQRGTILTAEATPLAETAFGSDGLAQRYYPYPAVAPVVGYYSLRYGTSGLEAVYDAQLRGQAGHGDLQPAWLADWLHLPQIGEPITVTLNLPGQLAANEALIEAEATGTIVVLNARSGEVLVMASQPTFDPNTLETDWESLLAAPAAPLLNRATQGLFPLGELARLIGVIGLLEVGARVPPDPLLTPLPDLLAPLGGPGLAETAQHLQFGRELTFTLPTAAALIPGDLPAKAEELSTTPLHLALVGAAIVQDGLAPLPALVYEPSSPPTHIRLMSAATAIRVRAQLTELSALATPEVTGNEPLSWYLGLVEGEPPLVVVAVVTRPGAEREAARMVAEATLKVIE
jgi:cell division protein FtsI/penicillin-binding protein 2